MCIRLVLILLLTSFWLDSTRVCWWLEKLALENHPPLVEKVEVVQG